MGTARLDSSIKMLVPLVLLLTSVLLDVEAEVSQGPCNDPGTTTTEESWSCSNGDSKCTKTVNVCNSNGFGFREAGYDNYLANGLGNSVGGGGWDCRHKCRSCSHTCSGSQSRIEGSSSGSGSNSGFGSNSGSRSPGGSGSQDCDYKCTNSGGCQVTYVGPPRAGKTQGSCFPDSFGGECSGTSRECQDCNRAINC